MRGIHLILILIILFVFIQYIIKIFFCKRNNDDFKNKTDNYITFLEADKLIEILYNDTDNYYDRFYDYDWKARNVKNKTEYINLIKNNNVCLNFTSEQKSIITTAINTIEMKITVYNMSQGNYDTTHMNLLKTPWIIGLTNSMYENGLPHTRGNVIILNETNILSMDLISILIHEKVHIYQKMYPQETDRFIKQMKFKKIDTRKYDDMIRVNPDTNNSIYTINNRKMISSYNSSEPTCITDIKYNERNQLYEHPLEWMAITITNKMMI